MKLQIALDTLSLDEALALLHEIADQLDIIEVGTPFIIEEGLRPVRIFKGKYPDIAVLADVKIMDAGYYEAKKCFAAGADIVTVLAVAYDETIRGAVEAAKEYDREIMVDMIGVKDLENRAKELEAMDVDYICVHTAFDIQSDQVNPLKELEVINNTLKKTKVAVAGGLKLNTISQVINLGADVLVVGGGIINEKDRLATTIKIKELIKNE